jgi:NADPH-dependent curcumin reductase CurA
MKISDFRMVSSAEPGWPHKILCYGSDAADAPTLSQVDAWCHAQYPPGTYVVTTSGWRFKSESDALQLLITWS